jgi:hypothetical protein
MTVPETAMGEQNGISMRKYQIGPSGQMIVMQSKPKAKGM